MTSEDLRAIITPSVEADLKAAGLWPTREGLNLSFHKNLKKQLLWGNSVNVVAFCHPDDAYAQVERRLVEDALSRGLLAARCGPAYGFVKDIGPAALWYPTLLEAALAAFAGRNRTAPTGEKEGA